MTQLERLFFGKYQEFHVVFYKCSDDRGRRERRFIGIPWKLSRERGYHRIVLALIVENWL